MYNVDYMINIHHCPHESFKSLNLGLKGDNLLLLPSDHLIWHDTGGWWLNLYLLYCLLQHISKKSTSTIIIFLILCPNEKKNFNLEYYPKIYTSFIF
jgi:hypothetical protein